MDVLVERAMDGVLLACLEILTPLAFYNIQFTRHSDKNSNH